MQPLSILVMIAFGFMSVCYRVALITFKPNHTICRPATFALLTHINLDRVAFPTYTGVL